MMLNHIFLRNLVQGGALAVLSAQSQSACCEPCRERPSRLAISAGEKRRRARRSGSPRVRRWLSSTSKPTSAPAVTAHPACSGAIKHSPSPILRETGNQQAAGSSTQGHAAHPAHALSRRILHAVGR